MSAVKQSLSAADLTDAATALAATDQLLNTVYPGDSGQRQPVHTVYIPAQHYHPGICAEWGKTAQQLVTDHGGYPALLTQLGVADSEHAVLSERISEKLAREPIEDLRIDFEDGFGDQGDQAEDSAVLAAAEALAQDISAGSAPPFVGIRFKCFEAPTRERGIRTLDLFLTALVEKVGAEGLPAGLILTLPKVTTVAQVEVMVRLLEQLERQLGLSAGRLSFEVQVETPQVVIGADGTLPISQLLQAGAGRISGLHYGTYDYSAAVGVSPRFQSLEHPVADFAKAVMQVAAAGTGVRISDGSTNVIPAVGASALPTWQLHYRLVTRSLERAIYQGWDLHPAHLPSRFIATYAFLRTGVEQAATRLRNYVQQNTDGFLDEPATARPLAAFLARGVHAGAISSAELQDRVGIDAAKLHAIAYPQRTEV